MAKTLRVIQKLRHQSFGPFSPHNCNKSANENPNQTWPKIYFSTTTYLALLFIYVIYECPLSQIMFALRGDANLQSVIKIYSDTKVVHPKYYKHFKEAAHGSAIWADEKWADFWQIGLCPKILNNIAI